MGITNKAVHNALALATLCTFCGIASADYPIAGVDPSQRPAGAPVITSVDHDAQWYSRALHGVTRPYPASLSFLEDQGNWYTPFNHPGAPGPYDIRGWFR